VLRSEMPRGRRRGVLDFSKHIGYNTVLKKARCRGSLTPSGDDGINFATLSSGCHRHPDPAGIACTHGGLLPNLDQCLALRTVRR